MPEPATSPAEHHAQRETARGVGLALGAYAWWGLVFPFYLRSVNEAEALELLAMRVLFGVPVAFALVLVTGQWRALVRVVTTWRSLRQLMVTTPLIAANWYAFTYAVVAGKLEQASFGYYINPLLTIALGMVFLGERMRRVQWLAVGIAAGATVLLGVGLGGLPIIAITVAVTFGLYGLLRKRADADAATGLAVEMSLLFVPMLAVEAWMFAQGRAKFGGELGLTAMMTLAGGMTVVPLTLFAAATRRMRLATIGLLQYVAPTGQLAAALWFGSRLSELQWTAFGLIWLAVVVFSIDSLGAHRRARAARRTGARAVAAAEAMD